MKSPLAIDKETVTKFKITPEEDISPIQKMSFLREQLSEIQKIQWRSRVDVMHANRLTESDNEVLKQKGHQNLAQHLNEVDQFTGAIRMLRKLIAELEEEYPELKPEA